MNVSIALVYPDLLGTYGDGGNATVLAQRLRWRGHGCEVASFGAGEAVPSSCDLYVVGGGEDLPQSLAARKLAESRALHRAVGNGAVVLAICAGLQVLGESFVGPDGRTSEGLGLLGCTTDRGPGPRAVGEIVVEPGPAWAALGLQTCTGFENHGGVTRLSEGTVPVGRVSVGVGNSDGTLEGAVRGRVWGTYMHGPVLARNPTLADLLLTWVVGELAPLDDSRPEALHRERLRNGPSERAAGVAQVQRAVRAAGATLERLARAGAGRRRPEPH